MKIIGLSGKAGAGKDWLAGLLRPAGYIPWAFALPMKAAGFGAGFTRLELHQKPERVRKWLQEYGTQKHRNRYRQDFWIRAAEFWLEHLAKLGAVEKIVMTDVRFPNEAEWVRGQGGHCVRLWHSQGDMVPGLTGGSPRVYPLRGTPAANHPSETALDDQGNLFRLHMVNDRLNTADQALRDLHASGVIDLDEMRQALQALEAGDGLPLKGSSASPRTTSQLPLPF